jgi:hypothetical protein
MPPLPGQIFSRHLVFFASKSVKTTALIAEVLSRQPDATFQPRIIPVSAPDGKRYLRKWKIIGTNKDEDGENNQKVLSCHERAVHVGGSISRCKKTT